MIKLPVIFTSYRSLADKTVKLTFDSSEITPNEVGELHSKQGCYGYLAFKDEPFTDVEKEALEALKTDFDDKGKTHGQRLRAVFYRMWEKDNEGRKVFHDYYIAKMETLIEHFKAKLD